MEISRTALSSNLVPPVQSARLDAVLKPGALLEVLVKARLDENRFQLQVLPEGDLLTAVSPGELAVGQRLQVKVVATGYGPELRILSPEKRTDDPVAKALLELLPKQIPSREFAALLTQLPTLKSPSVPDSLRMAAEKLLGTLPSAESLMTPESLQTTIRNSGLFLESSLKAVLDQEAPLPENDLKANLAKLVSALRTSAPGEAGKTEHSEQNGQHSPPASAAAQTLEESQEEFSQPTALNLEKLTQKAEGALATLTLDQLASLPRDDASLSLQMHIPYTDGDRYGNAKLLIAAENAGAQATQSHPLWTATIELQPPELGSFDARIIWNGERVDVYLWSDKEETGELMRDTAEILRAKLEQAGLETGALTILDRPPPLQPRDPHASPLLDLRA